MGTVPDLARTIADAETFQREVVAPDRPVVLRGAVRDWPALRQAAAGPAALGAWLAALDNGAPVDAIMVPPGQGGRVFYDDALTGFNFLRRALPVSAIVEQVLRYAHFDKPPSVAVQSALIDDCLPGWAAQHPMPLLPAAVLPRLWLGNRIVTPAHFDESCNLACVVAGRRRFTLLPPDQIGNLYLGPLGHAPTGTPISLVDFRAPDLARFPRFRDAQAAMLVAELAPGDAIYIPPLWWHHVESLDDFNLMVNHWWPPNAQAAQGSALDALLHAVMLLRHQPEAQRRAWAGVFEHFVFGPQDAAVAHLPPAARSLLAPLTPEKVRELKAFLADRLR